MTKVQALLITGAFIASLFFNGLDLRFFTVTFCLLSVVMTQNAVSIYRHGLISGSLLIPVSLILFWAWLGLSIYFSQVKYLSIINFWWLGVLPLAFLFYSTTADKTELWNSLIKLVMLVVFALCVYSLYQVLVLQDHPRATFYNKNSLAALINLTTFPLLAYSATSISRRQTGVLLALLFSFTFLLGLINSRGALLGFLIALTIFYVLCRALIPKRRLITITVTLFVALVAANLTLQLVPHITGTDIIDRIATLHDAETAGFSRFVIWQPAWDLFLQRPWTGIGLGTYFLAIPPYLHVDDLSAGFYVHNDYLQIALEAGVPALILLLGILITSLYRFVKTLANLKTPDSRKVLFVSLFVALFSLAFHSIFTFNLYILPIMLIAGLFLGHFNYLADQLQARRVIRLQLAHIFHPAIYYFCLSAVAITLLAYFISIGMAHHIQQKAYDLTEKVRLTDAHRAFQISQLLNPLVDSTYFADANLLRKSALIVAKKHPAHSTDLLEEANSLLDLAETHNSLRPHTPYIRGLVMEQSYTVFNVDIVRQYEKALRLNPRFLPARIALVRYLMQFKKIEEADKLLSDGMNYKYRQISKAYLDLLELTHAAALRRGEADMARNVSLLLEENRQIYMQMKSQQERTSITNPY